MQISILMSVGAQNLGDELILKNEIKLLKERFGQDTRFKVFSYDTQNPFYIDENLEYLEYFPIGIKNPKNIKRNIKNYLNFIKTIKKSDKVIIGGGGIFFDNEYGNYSNPLSQWLFRVNIINLLKKDLIIYGVSIDIKSKKNYSKIKNIFKKASEVYVRDNGSSAFLKSLGIKSEIINDPVFSDKGEYVYYPNIELKSIKALDFNISTIEGIDFFGKKIGIAFRQGFLDDENNNLRKIIDYITSKGGEVIMLPHSFHKIDNKANDYLFLSKFVKGGGSITKSMEETYEVYTQKKIDICLSMRLHSVILSKVYGIEYVKVVYADKLKSIK